MPRGCASYDEIRREQSVSLVGQTCWCQRVRDASQRFSLRVEYGGNATHRIRSGSGYRDEEEGFEPPLGYPNLSRGDSGDGQHRAGGIFGNPHAFQAERLRPGIDGLDLGRWCSVGEQPCKRRCGLDHERGTPALPYLDHNSGERCREPAPPLRLHPEVGQGLRETSVALAARKQIKSLAAQDRTCRALHATRQRNFTFPST